MVSEERVRRHFARSRLTTRIVDFQTRFALAHRMLQDTQALNDRDIRNCTQCEGIVEAEAERIAKEAILRKTSVAKATIDLSFRDFSWPQAPRTMVTTLSNELFNQHSLHSRPEEW